MGETIDTEAAWNVFLLLGADDPDSEAIADQVLEVIKPDPGCALQLISGLMAATITLMKVAGVVPDLEGDQFFGIVQLPSTDPSEATLAAGQVLVAFMNSERNTGLEIAWTKINLDPVTCVAFMHAILVVVRQTILVARTAQAAKS
jgi:hypothetical protein